ncbi:VRR-NUC domain-containing protein [Calidithermus chliarophilus]|uniref:VRR-NUC domain-containing protein n=1 Tax=Calidithermus chliarophilus TaxID=52023 RepID=UPI00040E7C1F|nr:VRR-NUC domain-containing protein [Calidithermus chliarophilus]
MKPPAPSERDIQRTFFQWVALATARYPELELFHAIPNGAYMGDWQQERRELAESRAATGRAYSPTARRRMIRARNAVLDGLREGIPDTHLPVPRGGYASLYIEFKRPGGKPSPEQARKIRLLREHGNLAVVLDDWQKAKELTEAYLKGEIPPGYDQGEP